MFLCDVSVTSYVSLYISCWVNQNQGFSAFPRHFSLFTLFSSLTPLPHFLTLSLPFNWLPPCFSPPPHSLLTATSSFHPFRDLAHLFSSFSHLPLHYYFVFLNFSLVHTSFHHPSLWPSLLPPYSNLLLLPCLHLSFMSQFSYGCLLLFLFLIQSSVPFSSIHSPFSSSLLTSLLSDLLHYFLMYRCSCHDSY